MYVRSDAGGQLHQGEIVTGLQQALLNVEALGQGQLTLDVEVHPFAIILTQECDLEQDHRARAEGHPERGLRNVLFLSALPIPNFRAELPAGGDIWRAVSNNKNDRYQVLQRVAAEFDAVGEGVPALGTDFKRCFTLPMLEVLFRIQAGTTRRRARLNTPWAEHLSSRFAFYLARVGLPQDHDVNA